MIKKWHLKAIIQKTIAVFPHRHQLNFLFQKYVTRGVVLNKDHFLVKFSHGVDHVAHFLQEHKNQDLSGITCLEIGSGWYPIVPLCYYLQGAERTYSYDISSLTTIASVLTTIRKFVEYETEVRQALPSLKEDRWSKLQALAASGEEDYADLDQLAGQIHLILRVQDARDTKLADQSIDLISSNNTFEHVDPAILKGILQEFWRVLKLGGLMSHFIDMSDHFAHMDSSISIYNYLQFSEKQWQWIDNRIQPQNRWRLPQYKQLYDQMGIPFTEAKIRAGNVATVKSMKLAPPFSQMKVEDVAVSHGYLLSVKH